MYLGKNVPDFLEELGIWKEDWKATDCAYQADHNRNPIPQKYFSTLVGDFTSLRPIVSKNGYSGIINIWTSSEMIRR